MVTVTEKLVNGEYLPPPPVTTKCGLRGCKNRPAPFPGRMLYKATIFLFLACFNNVLLLIRPFLCIVNFRRYVSVFWLF